MPPRKRPPTEPAVAKGTYGDPSLHLQAFLQYQQAECGMAKNTTQAYRSDLVQFFEWFRLHGPESLNSADLSIFTAYLGHLHERQLAMTTIARHLVAIKMFFRYLVLEGVLVESLVDLLSSP